METDRFMWLEDVQGDEALAWVREQNAKSSFLGDSGEFRSLEARFRSILDSAGKIPHVQKIGSLYYNFWRDAKHPRGIWRRTTLEQYRLDSPEWETVVDVDELAGTEGENWVWHGAHVLRPSGDRCIIGLSRGGADADVKREFDLDSKSFVDGGFRLPEAKSQVAWRDRDSIFVGTDFGPGSLTDSGYPRIVKEWRRGTPLESAETVFQGSEKDMSASAYRDHSPGFERDVIVRQTTFFSNEVMLRNGSAIVRLDVPADARTSFWGEWMLLNLRSDWEAGGRVFESGALLAIRLHDFLAGDRRFSELFKPAERTSLSDFSCTRNRLLMNVLDNVSNRLFILTPPESGMEWMKEPMPGVPDKMTAAAWPVDRFESDDYFLDLEGYLNPSTICMGTAGGGAAQQLKSSPAFFDAKGLAVTRHEARSADGTSIPYFQVGPENLRTNGENMTLMTGYGGFEIAMMPYYSPLTGAGWLEKGGVFVVANIRGGGEFGPEWHKAAMKEKRHKAYEDFAAVAEDLIRRKVTSPGRFGISGGSNGGLLVGNMLTRRPDLFGAIVCQVPLLDMKRYHKLLAGASWMAEYGDPDKPEEWEYIRTFSPYHNLKRDCKYPPTLVMTSTRDDRVHPGHARKMVALMKDQGHTVHYYENIEGGHGGAADNAQAAHMYALSYTFLARELATDTDNR